MRIAGRILVILGILAILPAGFVLVRDMATVRGHDGEINRMTEERTELRDELTKVGLELRGFQKSVPSIPDSIKKATSKDIMARSREYGKRIRLMEQHDRELTRLIRKHGREKDELVATSRQFAGRLGGGGILLMAVGFVLIRIGRR